MQQAGEVLGAGAGCVRGHGQAGGCMSGWHQDHTSTHDTPRLRPMVVPHPQPTPHHAFTPGRW